MAYRGLGKETAQKVKECYDLPCLPPHRPEMVINIEILSREDDEDGIQVEQTNSVSNNEHERNNDINNNQQLLTVPIEQVESEDNDQDQIVRENEENTSNTPMEGSEITNQIHTKNSKDLPRSRVDASYHSIADKSNPTLEYRGVSITTQHDIRIATLNVNGLNTQKLSEILWWIQMSEVDVFIGIDTRSTEKECKNYKNQCYQTLGATTVVRVAPIPDVVEGK